MGPLKHIFKIYTGVTLSQENKNQKQNSNFINF